MDPKNPILEDGTKCRITTILGLDARKQDAKVVKYLATHGPTTRRIHQYIVETENTNRYIRYLDQNGNEDGVDAIKALLMQATDVELADCKEFINNQLSIMH